MWFVFFISGKEPVKMICYNNKYIFRTQLIKSPMSDISTSLQSADVPFLNPQSASLTNSPNKHLWCTQMWHQIYIYIYFFFWIIRKTGTSPKQFHSNMILIIRVLNHFRTGRVMLSNMRQGAYVYIRWFRGIWAHLSLCYMRGKWIC